MEVIDRLSFVTSFRCDWLFVGSASSFHLILNMKTWTSSLLFSQLYVSIRGFTTVPTRTSPRTFPRFATEDDIVFENEQAKQDAVGNLVADDEWMGLRMELSETIRMAVVEDLKVNARDFLGKDVRRTSGVSTLVSNTHNRTTNWATYPKKLMPASNKKSPRCGARTNTNWVTLCSPWTAWPRP